MGAVDEREVVDGLGYEDRGGDCRTRSYRTAVRLAHGAFELSLDPVWASPFALEARMHQGVNSWGGKPDDITVVVSHVVSDRGVQGTDSWCHKHFSNICERRGG